MVYINLSVDSFEDVMSFYQNTIGLFYPIGESRLVCEAAADLIIDLVEVNSEQHEEVFGQRERVCSSFWIKIKCEKIAIIERLQSTETEYSEKKNLGGHFLGFIDPAGNRFSIVGDHGQLE